MLAKKFGFGFGIAIILPMLVHYGVSTFTPKPKWDAYYDSSYLNYQKATEEQIKEHQRVERIRQDDYRKQQKVFERHLFFTAVPVGLLAIIVGSLLAIQAVGAGLIFGGIFTLIDGYCWYWTELEDWMRFLSLLVAFIVLVYMGYKRLHEKEKIVPVAVRS